MSHIHDSETNNEELLGLKIARERREREESSILNTGTDEYQENIKDEYVSPFSDEYEAAENRGLEKGRKSIIEKMLRKGKTPEEIAELTDISIHVVRKIQESMMQLA